MSNLEAINENDLYSHQCHDSAWILTCLCIQLIKGLTSFDNKLVTITHRKQCIAGPIVEPCRLRRMEWSLVLTLPSPLITKRVAILLGFINIDELIQTDKPCLQSYLIFRLLLS